MNRIKEVTAKKNAASLDKAAAARFVRNALWVADDTKAGTARTQQQAKQRKLK